MKQNRIVDFAQKIRERISAAAAKRLARAALAVCLVAGCAALSATAVSAEGTRDIVRTSRENYAAVTGSKLPEGQDFQTYTGFDDKISRWSFYADGSQFMGLPRTQKAKFYANKDEVIYIGTSVTNQTCDFEITYPDGTVEKINVENGGKGQIKSMDEEMAGPNGVVLDGKEVTGGYTPYEFTATQAGPYVVSFHGGSGEQSVLNETKDYNAKNNVLNAWDVTVTRTEGEKHVAISGRVWVDELFTEIKATGGMYGYLYAVSRDGYIWRFGYNGMKPYTFTMYANTRGNISSATNASAYHSVHSPLCNYTGFNFYKDLTDIYGNPDGVYLLGPDNDETDIDMPCHMFINEPDENIPDTIVKTTAEAPGKLTSIRYDGSDVEDEAAGSVGDEKKNNLGFVGVDGYFEIETENASSYRIIIDMSNMYAISYHGEEDGSSHHDESIHDDEICLGAGSEKDGETDDTGIDPNNFIYHDSANQWYAIRTIKKTTDGKWDHHPTNSLPTVGGGKDADFTDIIEYVKIDAPNGFKTLGEDFVSDGKVYKCLGKVLLGNAAVSGKTDRIRWNGRDQYGRALPVGWYFGTTGRGEIYAQIKAGEVHFPLCDVESMTNGVSVLLMNPPTGYTSLKDRSSLYYNNEDRSLLHEYITKIPTSDCNDDNISEHMGNGRISWVWNLPHKVSNSVAKEVTDNLNKLDWRGKNSDGSTNYSNFENHSIDGVQSINADLKTTTNNANVFSNNGADHGIADVWTHVIDPEQYKLNDTIYLYHISDQMIVEGFVFFDGNTPGGDSKYDLSGNDTALYNATVVAEWGAVTSESLQKYNGTKDPTVLEFQKNGKNTYGYYKTSTNTDGIYSIPIDTTLFQVQGNAAGYVANTEHYVRITVTYEDEHTGKASITTHKVTTATSAATQRIEEKPNVSVQIVSVKSTYTNLKEINAEQVGYAIMPTTNPLRIRKIWTPDQLRDPSMTSTFTIKGILANDATSGEVPEKDKAFDDPAKIVFTLENVSVDENLGGIVDITSLPQYGYTIDADKHLSSEVEPKNGVAATDFQKIIYRVEENLKKESDSAIAPDILHDSNYKLEGGGAGTTVTTFDYWQFTNTIETSSLTVKVWYDKDNDGTFDTGEDSYLENAEITMGVKDPSSGDLVGFKTFPDYEPGKPYEKEPVIVNTDTVNKTKDDGTFAFSGIGAGVYNVTVKFPTADNYNTYWENGVTYKADGDVKPMIFNKGVQQNIVISEFTVGSGDNGVLEIRVGGFEDVMSLGDKFTIKKQFTSNAVDKIPQGSAEFGLKIQTHGDEGAMNDVSEGTATATVDSGAISGDSINPVDFDLSDFKAKITSTESVLHLSEKTDSGEAGYIAGVDYDESEYEITVKATNNPGDGGLNPHTTYTINEVKKVKDEDGKEVDGKIDPTDGKYNITFNNDYSVGRLTIKIGETEGESADRNAKFGISLTPVGAALAGKTYKYQVFNSDNSTVGGENTLTFVDGVLKVCDLTEKQYVVIYDLPLGVSLTVGESLADGYSLKEKKIDNEISSQNNVEIKATDAEDGLNNHKVEFINLHKEGSLSITKTVTVKDPTKDPIKDPDHAPDFTFNITIEKPSAASISALSIANSVKKSYNVASPLMTKSTISAPAPIAVDGFNYSLTLKVTDSNGTTESKVQFTNGGATVKLKDGQTATISGLPEGYSYKVVEADIPAGFVEGDKSNDSGKIVYNDTAAATFTNNFKTGSLSIENTTTDGSEGEYTFNITLTAPSGVTLAGSYAYTVGGDERSLTVDSTGKAKLTLKGGETAVIKGLPAGTHFEITETPASGYVLTYVTVDGDSKDLDDVVGSIEYEKTTLAHFWNSPVVKQIISGTKQISGIREWDDSLDSGKYSFTITAGAGTDEAYLPEIKTVKNVGQSITFDEITYDKPGTYTYSVSEEDVPAAVGGVSKDESVWTVTVTVVTDSDHALKVDSVNYSKTGVASASEFTFTNKYTATAAELTNDQQTQLKITKNLTGPISDVTNRDYEFTVTRTKAPKVPEDFTLPAYSGETVNITVNGSGELYTGKGDIKLENEYTYPGEYVYEVSETNGAASGVTYDSTVYTVTVLVSDNNMGELSVASVTITGGENDGKIVFNNTYSVEPVEAAGFDINKTLKLDTTKFSGQSVNFPEDFNFSAVIKKNGAEVTDGTAGWLVDGALSSSRNLTISQTEGKVGEGATTVPEPKFTATGTYVLEITEENPTDSHIAKDSRTLTVTYTVTDKGGALEVTSTSTDDLTFNNVYTPSPVSRTVSFGKKLINTVTGVDLLDNTAGLGVEAYNGKFSFKLEKADENPGAEVKVDSVNNNWGDVVFGDSVTSAITFDRAGTFKFKITETSSGSVIEGEPEITTSTEEIYVQYDVTVDSNGVLTAGAPKYTKKADSESAETSISADEAYFKNTYGPVPCVLTISKEITTEPGGIEIDRDQTFTFEITLEDGDAVKDTIANAIKENKIFYVFQPAGGIMTTALNDSGEGGRIYVDSATFEIVLKAGQSAQIQGIPYLTRYTVTEKDLPDGYSISEITHDGATENNPVEGAFGSTEDDSTEVNFTNLYTLDPAEVTLPELTKVLSGRALVDGEFSFTATITDEKGAVFSSSESTELTVQNSADGNITLGNIKFTKPGTYKVTVKENVDMTLGDVVFDEKTIELTYTVTDNKDGTLNVSAPTISDNDLTFENVFKTGELSITNTTTDDSEDEYTFEITLTPPDGVDFAESYTYTIGETDYNLTVDSDGKAELKLNGSETAVIKGLPAGTTFEITETPASGYVLTYVEVDDTEDADKTANGTIPNGSGIAAQFRNSPTVKQTISGTKQIEGIRKWDDSLDSGKYSFTITATGESAKYLPENKTVQNSEHEVKFDEITYDKPGTYTYSVSEEDVPAAVGGVSKDESVWTVTVTVVTDSDHALKVDSVNYSKTGVAKADKFTFTNKYTATATAEPQTLEITKKIATNEGINPAAEVYRFEAERVLPAGDEFSKTYTISMAAGELEKSAEIELETYTEPGEYVYEIAEIAGGTVGMTYDSGRFRVTVEVSDDSIGGLHSAIKSIEKIGEGEVAGVVFENKFATGTLEITKKTRGLGVDPLEEFKFTISLKDENGEPLSGEYGYTTEGSGFRPFGPAPFALANLNVVSDGSEISLKAGETVKIVGLPVGAVYTVSEEDAGGYSVFVSTRINGLSGAEVESASASGKIVDGTTSLVFVNEKQKQFEFKQFAFKNEIYPGDGESVEPGDEIIYELGWQNPTLKEATIVITDKLDNHVEYVDAGDERLSYDPGTHTVTATVEAGPLKSGTLELTVRVKAGAHGDIENKATATVDGTEYECETEEIKNPVAGITVEKAQSLNGGEKTESLVEARRGDVITYYLTVTANSEDPSAVEKNVTVKDMIPEGLSVVAGSVSDGGEIDENGLMSWNLGELAAGESVTVSYSVEIPQVSKDATWSGKGYVYAGEDPAENEPDDSKIGEEGYHWKASEELSAHAVGDLVLTKRVISSDGSSIPFGVEFDFTIELSLNGDPLAGGYVYETTSGASGAVFDGKLETELADGESVTIKSLPAGAEYRISESPVVNYQSDKTDNTDFGAVLNTANEVIFTNDYSFVAAEVGGLTVTNVVIGEQEDLEKTFTFTVTLLDGGINGTYGEMTFIDGVATFTLSNGMSIEARGLPSHIGYTVSEAEANADGFTTQSVNAEGAIPVGTSADAVFTNFKRASASGELVIRSTVDGTIQDEAASYGFTVTLDDPGVNGLYGDLFFENGVARAAIVGSSSVSASGLPAGAGYSVVFDGAFGGGISVSAHNDVGAIPAGGTATADFVISRELGNLTVMKTVSGEAPLAPQEYGFTVTLDDFNINGTYGEMTFIGGTASFSLSGGQSVTAYGLPAGVGYSVSEEPGAGYTVSASGNIGVIPQSATATASFINTYAAPLSLTITKAVAGKPAELPFDFRVTLTPPAGEILDSVAGIMLDEFGAGVIQIYGGQSAIISGIPEGTQYTVEELYSGTEFNTEPAKSGIISAAGEAVTFFNTRKVGSLTVRNTVVGTAADLNRAFNFTVTLSDPSINGRFGDMTFVGGTASFALSGGQNVTASDLPAGIGFTVNETDAGADGYTATVFGLPAESGYSGFIAENADSAVEFINEKNGAPALGGSLTVINNVIGTTTDELFTFTVRFTDLSGNIVFPNAPAAIGFAPFAATSGEPVYNPDGTVTVSLRHGESQTFTGLPAETLYEVVETRNLYYSVTSITPQGLIPDGSMAVAVFNNRWNAGGLDVSVKVENDLGAILDYDESEYEFTVTLSDFDGSALSGFVYPSHIPASGWGETDADVLMSFDENGVATFTLKNGQSASAPDLPGGIGYTIEAVSKDGRYIGKISGTNTEIASGNTVADENVAEDFTFIIRTGSIKITKTLLNYYGELLDSKRVGFEFEVKLVAPDGSVLKGAYVYSDGEHRGAIESGDKVTVYNEEPLTISGIPEGTSYEIIEESKQGYMITEKTGIEGTVSVGATAEVGYTNKIAGMIPPVPADQKDPDDDKPSGGGGGGGTEPDEPEDPDDGQTEVIPGDDIIIDRPTEGAFAAEDPASAVKRAAAKGAFPAALGLAALALSRRLRAK